MTGYSQLPPEPRKKEPTAQVPGWAQVAIWGTLGLLVAVFAVSLAGLWLVVSG